MSPKDYSDYGLAQELLRLRTHAPELMAEAAKRLAALAQPAPVQAGAQQAMADVIDAFEAEWNGFHLDHGDVIEWVEKMRAALAAPTQAGAGDAKGGA